MINITKGEKMPKEHTISARKRLFDETDETRKQMADEVGSSNVKRGKAPRKKVGSKQNVKLVRRTVNKAFVPKFEKPATRSYVAAKKQLITNTAQQDRSRSKTSNVEEEESDKSNNNASVPRGEVLVNPDPSKYVLTKWCGMTFLGKRKQVPSVDEQELASPFFDGVTVNIDDNDEFAEECNNVQCEQPQPSTSRGGGNTRKVISRCANSSSDEEVLVTLGRLHKAEAPMNLVILC